MINFGQRIILFLALAILNITPSMAAQSASSDSNTARKQSGKEADKSVETERESQPTDQEKPKLNSNKKKHKSEKSVKHKASKSKSKEQDTQDDQDKSGKELDKSGKEQDKSGKEQDKPKKPKKSKNHPESEDSATSSSTATHDESRKEKRKKKEESSANTSDKKGQREAKSSQKSPSRKSTSSDLSGLDSTTLALINLGRWPEATERLATLSAGDKIPGRRQAWLAFAYMYQSKRSELNDLTNTVKAMAANPEDPLAGMLVQVFSLTLQGKQQEAQDLLTLLQQNPKSEKDMLFTFAQACVAMRLGRLQESADLVENMVEQDPGFAWGYRTLGYLQEKSLKNTGAAERAYQRALAVQPDFKDVRDLLIDLKLARNDFDGAIELAQDAIKQAPKDPNNHYKLSQIYTQQYRLIEALAELDKAAGLAQDDARWYRNRANIFRRQGKLEEAIGEQHKAVQFGKDAVFELIELASLQEINGDTAGAIASLNRALLIDSSHASARQKLIALLQKEQKWTDLVTEYKKGLDTNPKQANMHLGLAMALKNLDKTDDAITELKEVANLDQDNPVPHREIGKIELQRKNYQAAAKSYTRALNINPASVEDLVALGYCYANNNDLMQAETAFVTGLALQQLGMTTGTHVQVNQYDIMRSLASVLMTEGRYREAVVNLEAVVGAEKDERRKREDDLTLCQAKALRDRNDESMAKLVAAFNSLHPEAQKELLEEFIDTLYKLGKKDLIVQRLKDVPKDELKKDNGMLLVRYLQSTGDLPGALETAVPVAQDDRHDPDERAEVYLAIASIKVSQKDNSGAEDALQKAAELNPKGFEAFAEKSKLYLQQQKFEQALAMSQKALELNPYSAFGYLYQGESYMGLNKVSDAVGNYLKATELYPTLVEAHKKLREAYLKQSKADAAEREAEIIANLEKPNKSSTPPNGPN